MRALVMLALLAGCPAEPTPTGATCPDPDPGTLTYESFGQTFMEHYCTWCHASDLPRSQRNGAPIYHDYDSLLGVLETIDHVDEQAGFGPDAKNTLMPPDDCPTTPGGTANRSCPRPTDEERRQLSEWLACEKLRPHSL